MDGNKTKEQKLTQAGKKMEFESKLENVPCDRTGHQSPHSTLTSFPLFSHTNFRGKSMPCSVPCTLHSGIKAQISTVLHMRFF